jgi:hypothetical protein
MKILKTLTCTIAVTAALAFCASSAKAAVTIVGQTDSFSKFNIALTIVTNAPETETGNSTNYVDSYKTGKTAINNKTLIAVFASWSTNDTSGWAADGAQLIYDWDSEEVCVADKSGTNILFYADDGTPKAEDAYFDFSPDNDDGAVNETDTYKGPTETWTGTSMNYAYFEFENWDGVESSYVYFEGFGVDNSHYSGKQTATTYTWTETDSIHATGDATFEGNDGTITSGTVSMNGKGNE